MGVILSAPQLAIVVDAEEEFDWTQPFSRENQSTTTILAQGSAHQIYDDFGVIPTYAVDYPVVKNTAAVDFLGAMLREGRIEIGAQLHPWVTPPHDEALSTYNSYLCNLPADLQRQKIVALHHAIERAFSISPTIFKAGRYGFGATARDIIAGLGYQVDCSQVPHTNFARDGGPDFRGVPEQPYWLDKERGLLEIPLTVGFFGGVFHIGNRISGLFDNEWAARLHLPGLLGRTGILSRSRLTPEGISAAEQCLLLKALVAQGRRTFTLCYHSPSLVPGHTPYVRNEADLQNFLQNIRSVLTYFRDELGGSFTTLHKIRADHAL